MNFYNKCEAIEKMNMLSEANIPFIFIVDYLQAKTYIEIIDDVDKETCLYSFNGVSNSDLDIKPLQKDIHWKCKMPSFEEYQRSFDIVVDNIHRGNSFLTNLTCKVPIETNLTMEEIYQHSFAKYKLWIKDEFVCFSPEIFVRIDNGEISSYPMKGTINASLPDAEQKLMNDEKESAEHATIVDLIRNDLSIIARNVEVRNYRYIDKLITNKGPILQTSSEVRGCLAEDYKSHIGDILFSLLPAGSITGAPKKKTMEIIDEAEGYDRDFYTGVMGYYRDGNLDSAVMIRFIDQIDKKLYFKAGGGITSLSQCDEEFNEVEQKIYVPIY